WRAVFTALFGNQYGIFYTDSHILVYGATVNINGNDHSGLERFVAGPAACIMYRHAYVMGDGAVLQSATECLIIPLVHIYPLADQVFRGQLTHLLPCSSRF